MNITFIVLFLSCHTQIEEVPGELTQDDLATDDVMILDTWDQVRQPGGLMPVTRAQPRQPRAETQRWLIIH